MFRWIAAALIPTLAVIAACAEPGMRAPSSEVHPSTELRAEIRFSTYFGKGPANVRTVAVDPDGNIFLAGGTKQVDWPRTSGPEHAGHSDVLLARFDSMGRRVWSRLIGGAGEDYAYVSAVNSDGELFLAGRAGSDFPTTAGAFDTTFGGGRVDGPHLATDAFVAKFSRDGEVLWSTYIGGRDNDNARAIHLLPDGRLIVAGGNTSSPDLPTDSGTLAGPVLKPKLGGRRDSWVALLAADGKSLEFLTYFGPNDDRGGGDETIRALAVDSRGDIWLGGTTNGTDLLATPDAFQKSRGEGPEAFVAKLSSDGRRLLYFSWLGGSGNDEIETEGVSDAQGNFYVAGSTSSPDFPVTRQSFQQVLKGAGAGEWSGDGWVARINDDGTLGFATYFGGSKVINEGFFGPAVDAQGRVYCNGRFESLDLPITENAFQKANAGEKDAVLAVFDSRGRRLLYGSYFGGTGIELGRHLALHPGGEFVALIGETSSTDLPLVRPSQAEPAGAFLAVFDLPQQAP